MKTFLSSALRPSLLPLFAAMALGGCSDDDGNGADADDLGTIPEVAAAAGEFDTLVAAITDAGLADAFSEYGPFTVFAPTDAAFAALPEGTLEGLSMQALSEMLLYHVVPDELDAGAVAAAGALTTLLGDEVTITIEGESVLVNDARVTMTDIQASNGIIHVIDAVLVPTADEPELGTIPEVAAAAGGFDTLLGAVTTAGLAETLSGEGPFTVFAPTDDAFAALPEGTLESLSTEALTDILLYHVAGEEYLSDYVVGASLLPSLLGSFIKVNVSDSGATVAGVAISTSDIRARNGVIHVINGVMLPPAPIPQVAVEAGIFETLLGALVATGLDEALLGEGPFTVFAPSDDAFAALPEGTVESLTDEELANVLLYHVAEGVYSAGDVLASEGIEMLNGDLALPSGSESAASIETAAIVAADIPAANGLIHVIDGVILPPAGE